MIANTDRDAAGQAALLIIDMVSDLEFADADRLQPAAEAAVAPILRLRDAADAAGVPVIYVNDNHDEWHSERSRLVEGAMAEGRRGRDMVRRIQPREDDYFIIKPQFSGFYATNLPVLLPKLGVRRLILTGIAADICVLFTAADAHMREYGLWVPADTVASNDRQRTEWSLDVMRCAMGATTDPTDRLALRDWLECAA